MFKIEGGLGVHRKWRKIHPRMRGSALIANILSSNIFFIKQINFFSSHDYVVFFYLNTKSFFSCHLPWDRLHYFLMFMAFNVNFSPSSLCSKSVGWKGKHLLENLLLSITQSMYTG